MAYMDFGMGYAGAVAAPRTAPVETAARFSGVEWAVIAAARTDGVASLAEPGRVARAMRGLFGLGAHSRMADPRLEALRQVAVHAWTRGHVLPESAVETFLDAGFTTRQLDTMLASVSRGRAALRR